MSGFATIWAMKGGTTIPIGTGPLEASVGAELGSYRLVSLLGKGAMGRVFRARHLKLGREVAIKVLNPEYAARPDVVQRFFREAQVVNQIGHEHIVDVTDLVEFPGGAFLVMELLEGQSLRQVTRRKRRKWPTVRGAVEIMAQVCDALEAAHQHGVVHRDLKPDNVFVVKRGGRDYAKVLDFGVAKLKEPDAESTMSGMILGTPLYMSPEQATGKPVDCAADIWAAGVVLYELLSGAVPFRAESFAELAAKLRDDPAPALPAKTPRGEGIPPALGAAVMHCLEKRASDRFRSMGALAEALRAAAKVAAPSGGGRRLLAPAAALVLVAGMAAAVVGYDLWRDFAPAWARPGLSAGPSVNARPAAKANATPAATSNPTSNLNSTSTSNLAPDPTPTQTQTTMPGPMPTAHPAAIRSATRTSAEASKPSAKPQRTASAAHHRRVEKVEVELYSKPPGARVVRLDTGELLGRTPARVRVPKRSGEIAVRFTLPGYEPITASVDLATGGSATVAMRKSDKKAKSKKRQSDRPKRRSGV